MGIGYLVFADGGFAKDVPKYNIYHVNALIVGTFINNKWWAYR